MTAQPDAPAISLWCAFPDRIRDPALLSRYGRLLSEAEAVQGARFYFAADRHRYLVTRALVRTVLARYAAVAPDRLQFEPNAYGRPELAPGRYAGRRISFNVSHTAELVVLGVSLDRQIGVDVENTAQARDTMSVARHVLCPWEYADLYALPETQRHRRFFQYWTLKEAYVKARGMGLSIPLDHFGFRFQAGGTVDMVDSPALRDIAARWRFWQLSPAPGYIAAVCAERAADSFQPPALRYITPLVDECAMDISMLCASS